ncbi:SusC/RagA family TonB-linked outer membrane protein [Sphingobacterium sp. DK4209]|uniref:SusC/RagA family TonB-linked outer membrane protein n=1 Tax=Sphingobacterium zhuxiongii TaxID=2662364 RepID=A0A5Q0QH53_9SPHI|nr:MULTISPECIES: SusC/RagA family TonB-linked outer membrane protein [unclassified Sphingobacterium]MVZ64729.1 SusC/RagA family TonB-linked outer membrane protein [Sphingobacterium sp. DK4209]QGA27062.1 SusC/RagA family TonB-linked outer membrane protein [Sphingobacterium sp. dk4302]
MQKTLTHLMIWLLAIQMGYAQQKTLTGKVIDQQSKTPISGATVRILPGKTAGKTDSSGVFSIQMPADAKRLSVSVVGFNQLSRPLSVTDNDLTLELVAQTERIEDVVVTAMGIERKAKSLSYSTQVVKGDELTKVKDANPMNNLTGKVSGMQINRSSSGIGGSVNIVLRGFKSNRNNQPLYVIDGLPITNTGGSGSEGAFGGGTDRGDVLSSLNADDIASINVLKGASASALYGSQGANGAIMITTKKGAEGNLKIDVSSSITADQAFYLPKLQYRYGQTTDGSEESWGEKGSFKDPVNDFYNTGTTLINTVSLSGGTNKMQNYFSYGNTTNSGIIPTNKFNQHSLTFRNSTNFFDEKLHFDGSLMYSKQDIHNRPTSGLYFSPIAGMYLFPRGLDFDKYKTYEYRSPTRNLYLQDWWNVNADAGLSGTHHSQNPYWVLHRNPTNQDRDNIIGQAQLRYTITGWLSASARGTINKRWDAFERQVYAGTQGVLSGETIEGKLADNGRMIRDESENTAIYADFLLIGNKTFAEDWDLNFTAGTSINDARSSGWSIDQKKLAVANKFILSNIYRDAPMNSFNETISRRQLQSVFASTNLGYKDKLFLDLTARNDWSSTLANTPQEKKGYFYYSVGLSAIISDLIKLPDFISYSKLRLTMAEVGNDVGVYSTIPVNTLNTGVLTSNVSGPYQGLPLRPEISKSYEIGYEGRFWDNRVNLDVALYKTNTTDQYFAYQGPVGQIYTTVFLNAGNIQNKGIEVALGVDAIKGEKFNWNTNLNFTANRNKILELAPNLGERYSIGGNFNVLRLNGSFGDFWARTFLRDDNGVMVVDDNGRPQVGPEGYIGNNNPKSIVGWNNSFSYGDFGLSFSVDARFGGQVISVTDGYLNSFGVSEESALARDRGGVDIPAVKTDGTPWQGLLPAQAYYTAVGNRDGIIEGQVYGATNIRMREISLSYKLPIQSKAVKAASVSLTGRNLFFFMNDAPYDPELNTTTGAGGQGYDAFALPATRSYGLNLKFTF